MSSQTMRNPPNPTKSPTATTDNSLEEALWSYRGGIADGQRHGRGIDTGKGFNAGQRYEGEFVAGRRHGHGVFTWPNGTRYEGEYREDRRDGRGVHTWPDGRR
jgi:hypothetical protein